jgi:hypothetical protein
MNLKCLTLYSLKCDELGHGQCFFHISLLLCMLHHHTFNPLIILLNTFYIDYFGCWLGEEHQCVTCHIHPLIGSQCRNFQFQKHYLIRSQAQPFPYRVMKLVTLKIIRLLPFQWLLHQKHFNIIWFVAYALKVKQSYVNTLQCS